MIVAKLTQNTGSPHDLRLRNSGTDDRCIQATTEGNLGASQRVDVLQQEGDDA